MNTAWTVLETATGPFFLMTGMNPLKPAVSWLEVRNDLLLLHSARSLD